ncbi:hypothetical protein H2200_004247 [Cladophialophora chaetospira]|uniref:Uncharacterized protein n=1 Tax=Cladophialophora chaetospira TaxID=386627 RepID=A0AA39CLH7_9EURO|nr:hypothetical protein H2200_004247 [Cladophialophora chaetospira]
MPHGDHGSSQGQLGGGELQIQHDPTRLGEGIDQDRDFSEGSQHGESPKQGSHHSQTPTVKPLDEDEDAQGQDGDLPNDEGDSDSQLGFVFDDDNFHIQQGPPDDDDVQSQQDTMSDDHFFDAVEDNQSQHGDMSDASEDDQSQAEEADEDDPDSPRGKAADLLSMFYVAWNVQPGERDRILAEFANHFNRGRSLESVVAEVDKYCRPKPNKAWPPPCLNARIQSTASGNGGTMVQSTCPFCKKKGKICLFAKFAPGLNGTSQNTVNIAGDDVRWILKKRRATKNDPVDPQWTIGQYVL